MLKIAKFCCRRHTYEGCKHLNTLSATGKELLIALLKCGGREDSNYLIRLQWQSPRILNAQALNVKNASPQPQLLNSCLCEPYISYIWILSTLSRCLNSKIFFSALTWAYFFLIQQQQGLWRQGVPEEKVTRNPHPPPPQQELPCSWSHHIIMYVMLYVIRLMYWTLASRLL